jgi:hypothetical protein
VKHTRAVEDSNEDTHIREAEGRAMHTPDEERVVRMHTPDEEEERAVRSDEVRLDTPDEDEERVMRTDTPDAEEERVVRHEEVRMDEDEAGGMRMDVVGNMGNNMDNVRDNDHDRRDTGLALDLDHRVRLSLVSGVQCCLEC